MRSAAVGALLLLAGCATVGDVAHEERERRRADAVMMRQAVDVRDEVAALRRKVDGLAGRVGSLELEAVPAPVAAPSLDDLACKVRRANAEYDAAYLRKHGHGEPVGADEDNAGFWRCRDAAGITWESRGECD